MKSRITIEVDFDNGNQPIIQVIANKSDDVRDSLIQQFLQSLQHSSRWCKIEYKGEAGINPETNSIIQRWFISPIKPNDFSAEINLMNAVFMEWNK